MTADSSPATAGGGIPPLALPALTLGWELERLRDAVLRASYCDYLAELSRNLRHEHQLTGSSRIPAVPCDVDDSLGNCRSVLAKIVAAHPTGGPLVYAATLLRSRLDGFREAFGEWWRVAAPEGRTSYFVRRKIVLPPGSILEEPEETVAEQEGKVAEQEPPQRGAPEQQDEPSTASPAFEQAGAILNPGAPLSAAPSVDQGEPPTTCPAPDEAAIPNPGAPLCADPSVDQSQSTSMRQNGDTPRSQHESSTSSSAPVQSVPVPEAEILEAQILEEVFPPCYGPLWEQVTTVAESLTMQLPEEIRGWMEVGTLLGWVAWDNYPNPVEDVDSTAYLRWKLPERLRLLLSPLNDTGKRLAQSLDFGGLNEREIRTQCRRVFEDLSRSLGATHLRPESASPQIPERREKALDADLPCPSLGLVLKPNGRLRREGFPENVNVTGAIQKAILRTLMQANGGWCGLDEINACWPDGAPPSDNAREQAMTALRGKVQALKVGIPRRGQANELAYCLCHAWTRAADRQSPMTVPDAKAFLRRLTDYVIRNHLKDDHSPQRGMIYEYRQIKNRVPTHWFQREAGHTMDAGAWFACAMVNAHRATGDPFYKEVLTKWQLPFYLKMLNHSDELFTSERNDARSGEPNRSRNSTEWLLQGREKGFVPYWWDDGSSASIERTRDHQTHGPFPARDESADQQHAHYRLSGHSLGTSHFQAGAVACLLELAWLLLWDSEDDLDKHRATDVAQAARNLQECCLRHKNQALMVLAADGLTTGDSARLRRVPETTWDAALDVRNSTYCTARSSKSGQPFVAPWNANDQQHRYYTNLARTGTLTEPMAFRVICDAFTETRLFDLYYDDRPRPPGINRSARSRFDYMNGRPEHLRSQRGPGPCPVGSWMGPQTMICCGWALQALRAFPDLWQHACSEATSRSFDICHLGLDNPDGSPMTREQINAWHERELGGGLRTWEAIFDEFGYIPTGIGGQSVFAGTRWDDFSDAGGYAHLISAAAQWILYQEGRNDWDVHNVPRVVE